MRPIRRKTGKRANSITEELDNLQLSSWNLELLFSAVFLYVLKELKDGLPALIQYSNNISPYILDDGVTESSLIIFLASRVFVLSLNLLSVSLIVHIILRGFWIALIGLRYVSGQIDVAALNYSKPFEKRALDGLGYDKYIERVENICSVVYAFIFLILFFLLSFLSYLVTVSIYGWMIDLIYDDDGENVYIMLSFVVPVLIPFALYFIDTLTMGGIQRIKRPAFIGRIYSPLHKVMQYLTLSVLYRPVFHNFMDNKYSRRLAFSAIPLLILYLFVTDLSFQPSAFWPSHASYSELYSEGKAIGQGHFDLERDSYDSTPMVHFPSRYIDGNTLELIIRYDPRMDKVMEKKYPEFYKAGSERGFKFSLPDLQNEVTYGEFMEKYTSLFAISINDREYPHPEFVASIDRDLKALDFIAALDVSDLPYGYIHVKVDYPKIDFFEDTLGTTSRKITLIKR